MKWKNGKSGFFFKLFTVKFLYRFSKKNPESPYFHISTIKKGRGEMKKCKNCDPFENYDALVILTRQGCVMTSNDAQLTFDEDAQLYKLNKIIADRTKRVNEEEERAREQRNILRKTLGF